MGTSRITVGDVEISHLYDLVADFPMTLDHLFPTVPAQAWEPYRREYPSLFGPGNVPRFHVGCYLIRSRGRTILVDTGIGPSSLGMALFLGTGGQLVRGALQPSSPTPRPAPSSTTEVTTTISSAIPASPATSRSAGRVDT